FFQAEDGIRDFHVTGVQTCALPIYNGLLRKGEFESVLHSYKDLGLNVKGIDAKKRFMDALKGVTDPERKRKIVGGLFIEIFDERSEERRVGKECRIGW